jgi:hypothetical protein
LEAHLPKGATGDDFNKTKYDRIDPDTIDPGFTGRGLRRVDRPEKSGWPVVRSREGIVQPVVDGLFYHVVRFEGHDWAHYGRFVKLDRPSRIEHTWVSEATRGLESRVSLTFEPQADGTLVTLHHENLPEDDMGRRHREGWGFVLDAIAVRFARRDGD